MFCCDYYVRPCGHGDREECGGCLKDREKRLAQVTAYAQALAAQDPAYAQIARDLLVISTIDAPAPDPE